MQASGQPHLYISQCEERAQLSSVPGQSTQQPRAVLQSPARTAQSCPGSQVDFMKQGEPWANTGSGLGLVVVLVFSLKHVSYSHIRYNRARSTNPGLPCSSLPL